MLTRFPAIYSTPPVLSNRRRYRSLQMNYVIWSTTVHRCGLYRLNQFATHLSRHFQPSRVNPKFLTLLASLDEVLTTGISLPNEDNK
jgi:hypothetical protein